MEQTYNFREHLVFVFARKTTCLNFCRKIESNEIFVYFSLNFVPTPSEGGREGGGQGSDLIYNCVHLACEKLLLILYNACT